MIKRIIVLIIIVGGLGLARWFDHRSQRFDRNPEQLQQMADEMLNEMPPLEVDPAVTPELFRQWRSPREGRTNPERMNNPVWEWLIRNEANAFIVNDRLKGPSAFEAGPGWCFDRFGRSSTELPDGRVIQIAGEHEDHYDPDFYIYNDVVVSHPDGSIDIFGYPRDVFPPTDFHSATLVDNRILIIGRLGYPDQRKPPITPVYSLSLSDFRISRINTSGEAPGWIHEHKAALSDDGTAIILTGGKLYKDGDLPLLENIDDWKLHLPTMRWERLTSRIWPQRLVRRKDGKPNHLFDYQQLIWERQIPELAEVKQKFHDQFEAPTLEQELGCEPRLDVYEKLYHPPVEHEQILQSEDEFGIRRIRVQGVMVKYMEDSSGIQMIVEGDLPPNITEALAADLHEKLSTIENTPCELRKL